MELDEDLSDDKIMCILRGDDRSEIHKCLSQMKQKNENVSEKIKQLLPQGIIKLLFSYLELPELCRISLSVICNCCLDSTLCTEMIQNKGVKQLIRITKGQASDDIVNRACLALANISLTKSHSITYVQKCKAVRAVVKFLSSTDSTSCQQNAIRTLGIIAKDTKTHNAFLREKAYFHISKYLSSNHVAISRCCVKALAVLTQSCSGAVAEQISDELLSTLLLLYNQENLEISEHALICLENLAYVPELRIRLLHAGVVKLFVDIAKDINASPKKVKLAILAICQCCQDYSCQALGKSYLVPSLLISLSDACYQDIHSKILHTLNSFHFVVKDIAMFNEIRIYSKLIDRLQCFIDVNRVDHSVKLNDTNSVSGEGNNSLDCDSYGGAIVERESNYNEENSSQKAIPIQVKDNNESDNEHSDSESSVSSGQTQPFYSIHSPTYQGLQLSEPTASNSALCTGFTTSPLRVAFLSSPEYSLYDCSPGSPFSNSSILSPWSPGSSYADDPNICWSPVLSSRSASPESLSEKDYDDSVISTVDVNEYVVSSDKLDIGISKIVDYTSKITDLLPDFRSKGAVCSTNEGDNDSNNEFLSSEMTGTDCIKAKNNARNTTKLFPETSCDPCCSKESDEFGNTDICSNKDVLSEVSSNTTGPNLQKAGKHKLPLSVDDHDDETGHSKTVSITEPPSKRERITEDKEIGLLILSLLSKIISVMKEVNVNFIDANRQFSILIEYLVAIDITSEKAAKILVSLVKNYNLLEKLIIFNFFGEIDKIMIFSHDLMLCDHCAKVVNVKHSIINAAKSVAESEYGMFHLERILLKGEILQKLYCLYAINKLLNRSYKCKMLIKMNAHKIIYDALKSEQKNVFELAANILSLLYNGLVDVDKIPKSMLLPCCTTCKYMSSPYDVEFQLKDNIKVLASRKTLIENAPYFDRLLSGYYKESTQNIVTIPDIDALYFKITMHLLHGCGKNGCPFLTNLSLNDMLKMIAVMERFMMHIKEFEYFEEHLKSLVHNAKDAYLVYKSTVGLHFSSQVAEFALSSILRFGTNDSCYYDCLYELKKLQEVFLNSIENVFEQSCNVHFKIPDNVFFYKK